MFGVVVSFIFVRRCARAQIYYCPPPFAVISLQCTYHPPSFMSEAVAPSYCLPVFMCVCPRPFLSLSLPPNRWQPPVTREQLSLREMVCPSLVWFGPSLLWIEQRPLMPIRASYMFAFVFACRRVTTCYTIFCYVPRMSTHWLLDFFPSLVSPCCHDQQIR